MSTAQLLLFHNAIKQSWFNDSLVQKGDDIKNEFEQNKEKTQKNINTFDKNKKNRLTKIQIRSKKMTKQFKINM